MEASHKIANGGVAKILIIMSCIGAVVCGLAFAGLADWFVFLVASMAYMIFADKIKRYKIADLAVSFLGFACFCASLWMARGLTENPISVVIQPTYMKVLIAGLFGYLVYDFVRERKVKEMAYDDIPDSLKAVLILGLWVVLFDFIPKVLVF